MKKIFITTPSLPPLEDFIKNVESIWLSKQLSNFGPLHNKFEKKLAKFLKVKYVSLFSNATSGLIASLNVFNLKGEVITTPFSYIATTQAILWNNLKPVFVDINSETLNICPEEIEKNITKKTSAIMPIHCFGNPCDVKKIDKIAKKYSLKVIYDAAHAFGINSSVNNSLLLEGDLSVVSFHATKVFNTFEGGAVISNSLEVKKKLDSFSDFGKPYDKNNILGLNSKFSEVNAAMGLSQLKYYNGYISKRKKIAEFYHKQLSKNKYIKVFNYENVYNQNYSYYPIILNLPINRKKVFRYLEDFGIFAKTYFSPLITEILEMKKCKTITVKNIRNSIDISMKILCLPISSSMTFKEAKYVSSILLNAIKEFEND